MDIILPCTECGKESAQFFNTTGLCPSCRQMEYKRLGYLIFVGAGVGFGLIAPTALVGAIVAVGCLLLAENDFRYD